MERCESNFFYLKVTNIEKYYSDLLKAEYLCDEYGQLSKIILRKIVEELLRNIAEKNNMEIYIPMNSLIRNIKFSYNFSFPENICEYISIIRMNANIHNVDKKIVRHPIELFNMMNEVIKWYLKETESNLTIKLENIIFRVPTTITFKESELNKIRNDISLKDNQINNLRRNVLNEDIKSKNILQLNHIIIAIKKEKSYLEEMEELLRNRVNEQKATIEDAKKNLEEYMKSFNKLQEECEEIKNLINDREVRLVNAEIENQELKRKISCLYEQDTTISQKDMIIKEQLEKLRHSYKNELSLSKKYKDILNTIEFSYDSEVKRILEIQKSNIRMKINLEDKIFNETLLEYTANTNENKKSISIYREILNDKINREIKYEELYKGFLNLSGESLRILYILSANLNEAGDLSINVGDSLLKKNEEKLFEYLNRNIIKLKDIPDEEIQLILYYRFINLANCEIKNIGNRKYFINSFNEIGDTAYKILKVSEDNRIGLEIVKIYYIEKVILNLKNSCIDKYIKFEETFINEIYYDIKNLNKEQQDVIYKKLHLEDLSDLKIRQAIAENIFAIISVIASLEKYETYSLVYKYIVRISNMMEKTLIKIVKSKDLKIISNEQFDMFLRNIFIIDGKFKFNKFEMQQNDVLLLFIIIILMDNFVKDNDKSINQNNYDKLIDLWRHKQHIYRDLYMEYRENKDELDILSGDKESAELKNKSLSKARDELNKKYNNKIKEFEETVLNSEKIKFLPSYLKYSIFNNKVKNKDVEKTGGNKLSIVNSMLPEEIWDKHKNKIITSLNLGNIEELILEEAKNSMYFEEEYKEVLDIKIKMDDIDKFLKLVNEESNIDDKSYTDLNNKILELEKQLNNIKEKYPDIEEEYWN